MYYMMTRQILLVIGLNRGVLLWFLVLQELKYRILLVVRLLLICMGQWRRLYKQGVETISINQDSTKVSSKACNVQLGPHKNIRLEFLLQYVLEGQGGLWELQSLVLFWSCANTIYGRLSQILISCCDWFNVIILVFLQDSTTLFIVGACVILSNIHSKDRGMLRITRAIRLLPQSTTWVAANGL
jgi:hypothetical protein